MKNMEELIQEKQIGEAALVLVCPYCKWTKIIKKWFREKEYEKVQLYYCKFCSKKFIPLITKNKKFPFNIILQSINYYNKFNYLEESAKLVTEKYWIKITNQNISNWLKSFKEYLPFLRIRSFIKEKYEKKEIFVESKLFHWQIYDFKYHRAKTDLILDEQYKNRKLSPLKDLLELVISECPHKRFENSSFRSSDIKNTFNLT